MAESFEELGLLPELAEAIATAGYGKPTRIQAAAIPVLRRGSNAVVQGSAGAGITGAYGLALLDRLARARRIGGEDALGSTTDGLSALVLTPLAESASAVAESLGRWTQSCGLRLTALVPGWAPADGATDILVSSPGAALRAMRSSALKLEAVLTFIAVDAALILELGSGADLEVVTGSLPRDAQRVVTSPTFPPALEDHLERHVRRSLRIPARPAGSGSPDRSEAGPSLEYATISDAAAVQDMAALLLELTGQAAVRLYARSGQRAAALARMLGSRGLEVLRTEREAELLLPLRGSGAAGIQEIALSCDVPSDPDELLGRHAAGGVVLVRPRELQHLRGIASEVSARLSHRAIPEESRLAEELAEFRERLRQGLEEEDLGAQLLLLQPLLQDHSAIELAAAASALLRRRLAPAATPASAKEPVQEQPPQTWARLFVSTGQRDGIRPGDLVGAITGETGLRGDMVGRIEIRDTFSVVEVVSEAAQQIINALNGTTVKGRSLRVDFDRRTTSAPGTRRTRPDR